MADIEETLGKKPVATLLLSEKKFKDRSYQGKLKNFLSKLH
jgi:hypothetical protein